MKNKRPRVLLDACTLLAWIKGEPEARIIQELLEKFEAGKAEMVVAAAIFAEVFKPAGPTETWQPKMDRVLSKLRSRTVTVVDITEPVASFAAHLRLKHGLKSMDALHLAAAVRNRCDWLVTMDGKFPAREEQTTVFNVRKLSADELPWSSSTSKSSQPRLFDNVADIN